MRKQSLLVISMLTAFFLITSACAFVTTLQPTATPSDDKPEETTAEPSATFEPSLSPTSDPWTTWNGHEYRLTDPLPWLEAEAQAEGWGGTLVIIDNIEEEEWLLSQYGENENLWIGLNAIDHQGVWVWANGAPLTFTNWCDGEPTNFFGDQEEDAAVVSWLFEGNYGDCWNNLRASESLIGIVERIP